MSRYATENMETIRKELTVEPRVDPNYAQKNSGPFPIYKETPQGVIVPRYWKTNRELVSQIPRIPDFPAFSGTLKDYQKIIVNKTNHMFSTKGGGLMCVGCGKGKTTMSIACAVHLGVPTLVLVNKEALGNQWKERIAQFTPGARVGTLRADIVDIEDKHFVIGMIQSISTKDYPQEYFDRFDLVIVDEAHHICARVFSKAMHRMLNVRYTLALSATPDTKNGLRNIIHLFLGPTIVDMRDTRSDVTVVKKPYRCARFELPPPENRMGKVDMTKMVNIIAEDQTRTEHIVMIIHEFLNNTENHILVLSALREHCVSMRDRLGNSIAGLYLGGMTNEELIESASKRVVVATNRMADEGLDIPTLNVLLMATPKSDVVQSCGRVQRGAGNPTIVDIRDQWGVFIAQGKKRDEYYRKCGWIKGPAATAPVTSKPKYLFID